MVAGTKSAAPNEQIASANWWVASHCYTVMGYDETAQTVTLRNPWAGHPGPDGVFTLPLSVYIESYESYTYSQ
jgi:hypothetical protein